MNINVIRRKKMYLFEITHNGNVKEILYNTISWHLSPRPPKLSCSISHFSECPKYDICLRSDTKPSSGHRNDACLFGAIVEVLLHPYTANSRRRSGWLDRSINCRTLTWETSVILCFLQTAHVVVVFNHHLGHSLLFSI